MYFCNVIITSCIFKTYEVWYRRLNSNRKLGFLIRKKRMCQRHILFLILEIHVITVFVCV